MTTGVGTEVTVVRAVVDLGSPRSSRTAALMMPMSSSRERVANGTDEELVVTGSRLGADVADTGGTVLVRELEETRIGSACHSWVDMDVTGRGSTVSGLWNAFRALWRVTRCDQVGYRSSWITIPPVPYSLGLPMITHEATNIGGVASRSLTAFIFYKCLFVLSQSIIKIAM